MAMERIGFLGLGIMGMGMADRLAGAGYQVTAWNRSKSRLEGLASRQIKVADTPRQAACGNDVVITMLADPTAAEQVFLGPDGVLEGLGRGAVVIDCSTIDPRTSINLAAEVEKRGSKFLDSPVGGSKQAAANGELVLMVGGNEEVLEEVRPILETLARKIVYAGETGNGAVLKLCFNLIGSHMIAALAESLLLATRAGLDPRLVIDTISSSILASKFYEWKGECMLDHDFTTNFSVKLMHKDLNLMMSTAYDLDIPLPVTASVKELFGMAKSHCDADLDFSSVLQVLESLAGVTVSRPSERPDK